MFRKHLVLFLLVLFAAVVVILPQPAYAFDTYLPSLRRPLRDEDLPGYNPMPPATPVPQVTLRDGYYSSGTASVDISFRVSNSGATADYASFHVKSFDPLQFYCSDGFGYFSDSVGASNQKFSWTSLTMLDYARLNVKGTSMSCTVLSDTLAECRVYDPWAARSTLAQGCGAATAMVSWIQPLQ